MKKYLLILPILLSGCAVGTTWSVEYTFPLSIKAQVHFDAAASQPATSPAEKSK